MLALPFPALTLSGAPFLRKRISDIAAYAPAASPPDAVLYVVGDIHGRADLLYPLLSKIAFDVTKSAPSVRHEVIFLGDYVDRGPDSREVVQKLLSAQAQHDFWTVTALKGNHEATLLLFLEDPSRWPIWANFGAHATLRSYHVVPPDNDSGPEDWVRASLELNARMPQAHKAFLRGLALTAARGDYLCVHAGVRPDVALEDQIEQDLLWIRDDFLRSDRRLEKVIVHGHTPEYQAYVGKHRIGVDTGAYATSVLTAIRLEGSNRKLIQVRGAQDTRLIS